MEHRHLGLEPARRSVDRLVGAANIYPGAIILMHDGGGNRDRTVTALETVLSELQTQGYVMSSLRE